jgi:tripartite-type tricarboxylate transporter receptor subunit TctC
MAVHPSVPARTVGEFAALTKANPDKYNAAMIGAGAPPHLALTQFTSLTAARIVGVNYKGAGPAMAATVAGETQVLFSSYATMLPMVESGKLRLLAVTSAKRAAAAPQVPTASESGLPGFVFDEWYAIFAPAKTPRVAIDRMNAEVRKVLEMPDVRERMRGLASEPSAGTPEELGEFVRAEMRRFQKLITENNIKAE